MDAVTFYAFWNGSLVGDLFNAVVGITQSASFQLLIICACILGFLGVMLFSGIRQRGFDAVVWCVTAFCVAYLFYVPKIPVSVLDVRAGNVQVIQNVPLGLGWASARLSQMSYWLTRQFEAAFQDPDTLSFSKFGVAFPQRVVTALMSAGPITSEGKERLNGFVEHCVIPEVLGNAGKRHEMMTSANLWKTVTQPGWINPARHVVEGEDVLTCPQAATEIDRYLTSTEIPMLEHVLATQLDIDEELQIGALAKAVPGAQQMMLGISQDLTSTLKHTVMLSSLPASLSSFTAQNRSPMSLAITLSKAQGNLSSEINYRTLGEMAKNALPKVRNLLEFIVIALFPVVIVMMLAMGHSGLGIMRSYVTLLLSVALWAPIAAVINYLMIHTDAEPMSQLVAQLGGLSLEAATLIREAGASSQAMAGSLLWMVPLLAYAIAKGSDMAVTSMASSLLSPAQSAAQAQGSALAMGNVNAGNASVGNVSANNMTGNRSDMSSSYTTSDQHVSTNAAGSAIFEASSRTVTSLRVNQSDVGVNLGTMHSTSESMSEAHTQQVGFSSSVNRGYTEGQTYNEGKMNSGGFERTSGETVTMGETSSLQKVQSQSIVNGQTLSKADSLVASGTSSNTFMNASSANMQLTRGAEGDEFYPNNNLFNNKFNQTNTIDTISSKLNNTGSNDTTIIYPNSTGNNNFTHPSMDLSAALRGTETGTRSESTSSTQSTNSTQSNTWVNQSAQADSEQRSKTKTTGQMDRIDFAQHSSKSFNRNLSNGTTASESNSDYEISNRSKASLTSEMNNINQSPTIRDRALATFGQSTTDTLWELNSNTNSRNLIAGDLNNPNPKISTPLNNRSIPNMTEFDLQNEQRFLADQVAIESANSIQSQEYPEFSSFEGLSPTEQENRDFISSLTRLSSALYRVNETGPKSVISRGYLFGLSYSGPKDIYDTLKEKCIEDNVLKSKIIELSLQNISDDEMAKQVDKLLTSRNFNPNSHKD